MTTTPPVTPALDAAAIADPVRAFVDNYEWRDDGGDHTPAEHERAMLEDAINGFLATATKPAPDVGEAGGVAVESLPCCFCDGTGDVTTIDGEWRGYCICRDGRALAAKPAALAQPAAAETAKGWRPIETAPRDGTWFIALEDDDIYKCQWLEQDDGEGHFSEGWWDDPNQSFENPTCWIPLPTPPVTP